jgi:hypothetical protein
MASPARRTAPQIPTLVNNRRPEESQVVVWLALKINASEYLALSGPSSFVSGSAPSRAALMRLDRVKLLHDRYPDEHDAAIEQLDVAICESEEMKLQESLERARGHHGLLRPN